MQCCLFLVANPSVQIVRSPKPYSSSPPLRQLLETAGNGVEGRQHWGAEPGGCCRSPRCDRDGSAQCPPSVPWNHPKGKGRVHSHDLGLPATYRLQNQTDRVCGRASTQEECSLRLWCLQGLGTKDVMELLRPWAAFLGGAWPGPHQGYTEL